MKNLKISFSILAIACGMVGLSSCEKGQNPDVNVEHPALNTAAGVTVSMTNATQKEAEDQFSSGSTFVVPITITGDANGAVRVKFEIRGYGEHPAAEFTYSQEGSETVTKGQYIVKSREVWVSPDLSGRAGIEISTYPDAGESQDTNAIPLSLTPVHLDETSGDLYDDHQFEVVIVEAAGADINTSANSTVVTLVDNDKPASWVYLGQGQFTDVVLTGSTVKTDVYMLSSPNMTCYRLPYCWFSVGVLGGNADELKTYTDNYYGFLLNATNPNCVFVPEQDTGIALQQGQLSMMNMNQYLMDNGFSADEIISGAIGGIIQDGDNSAVYNTVFLGNTIFQFPTYSLLGTFDTDPTSLLILNGEPFEIVVPTPSNVAPMQPSSVNNNSQKAFDGNLLNPGMYFKK